MNENYKKIDKDYLILISRNNKMVNHVVDSSMGMRIHKFHK